MRWPCGFGTNLPLVDRSVGEVEGDTGQIAIDDDTLVLSRRGFQAKVNGLSAEPRRVLLAAISSVAFTPATRGSPGRFDSGSGGPATRPQGRGETA